VDSNIKMSLEPMARWFESCELEPLSATSPWASRTEDLSLPLLSTAVW
jgi:hypothetical protein